jgi:hypothetical protein
MRTHLGIGLGQGSQMEQEGHTIVRTLVLCISVAHASVRRPAPGRPCATCQRWAGHRASCGSTRAPCPFWVARLESATRLSALAGTLARLNRTPLDPTAWAGVSSETQMVASVAGCRMLRGWNSPHAVSGLDWSTWSWNRLKVGGVGTQKRNILVLRGGGSVGGCVCTSKTKSFLNT